MATREQIVDACDQYIVRLNKKDADAIVDLYDPNATVEDPLGTPPKVGHGAIREFYAGLAPIALTATRLGPVTVVGHEAAFQFRVDVELGDDTVSMVTTDLMTFNAAGKVIAMRAYADQEAKPGS
jgi:steroid delta-isomerase